MKEVLGIPVVESKEAGYSIYLLPRVNPVVYLAPGQQEATIEQEIAATIEAYVQAAKRGEIGVIKLK